jgi:hypothetical protein
VTHDRVYRWRIGAVAAGFLAVLGLLYASPFLLAATVVPLAYVVYGALSSVPADAAVRVERTFENPTPFPGQHVGVTLTVENASAATLPDLRVVDGVPDELPVVEGSPRGCYALEPGESATLSYVLATKRGEFTFEDPLVRLRPLSAAHVVTTSVPAAGEGQLSAVTPVSEAPVGSTTLLRAGTHPTDAGGEGLEFRSTREYQAGDPMNRIHWRRFAKTGELTTVSFREERAVRTVIVVDARPPGRVTPVAGTPTATALCGYAAERLYEALDGAGVVTSVTALGVDAADPEVPTGPGGLPWVDGDADDAAGMARLLFDAVQAVASATTTGPEAPSADGESGPEAEASAARDRHDGAGARATTADGGSIAGGSAAASRRLFERFPPTAQVVFVTPLLDDWPVEFVRTLVERDYPVTVVSPDATGTGSSGDAVVGVERDLRLGAVDDTGATTVSWHRADSIEVALADSLADLV